MFTVGLHQPRLAARPYSTHDHETLHQNCQVTKLVNSKNRSPTTHIGTSSMRKNPSRIAWTVLLVCFTVFCLLAVTIPLTLRWFLLHSEVNQPGMLRVAVGTILMLPDGADEPIAVLDNRPVETGTLIQTDGSSQGTLGFAQSEAQDSPEIATVQVYPSAQVVLALSNRSRFALSNDPNHIALEVKSGRVRINTSEALPNGLTVDVITPHTTVKLTPGSYAVQVSGEQTQISTRLGEALCRRHRWPGAGSRWAEHVGGRGPTTHASSLRR